MGQPNDHTTPQTENPVEKNLSRKEKMIFWFKRLGWLGFLFFLAKGIIWLVVAYFAGDAIFS